MRKIDRIRKQYENFTAAQGYILGFEKNGIIYAVNLDKIPRRFTTIQKECSRMGGGYGLYVNIKTQKAQKELIKNAYAVGTLDKLINDKYNKGVMFEKMVYEYYNQEFRGKEISIKYLHARICYEKTLKKLSVLMQSA